MQNAMQAAIVNAGLTKLPTVKERVWKFIKDNQGTQGIKQGEVARKLKAIPSGSISSVIAEMGARGMLTYTSGAGQGPTGKAKYFRVAIDTYELYPLPESRRAVKYGKKAMPKHTERAQVQVERKETAPEPRRKEIDLDSMTLAEARALYRRLHKMFGGEA